MIAELLDDWDDFYVIAGSSAAGLTGLTFVVIALAADAYRVEATGLRAFITPTVVHFGSVLALAAYLTVPHQGVLSLSIGFALGGLAGLVYIVLIATSMHRHSSRYRPVAEDWIWHFVLPAAAYGTLFALAFVVWRHAAPSLYGVGAVAILLLFIGIHNAWDIAVWISLHKQKSGKD